MKRSILALRQQLASCLAMLLIALSAASPASAQQAAAESPAKDPGAQPAPASPNTEQAGTAQAQTGQQNGNTQPVGTAAAPYGNTTGVAASRPAGAVIAPAKQRRVRTILIRIGVVVGAGVAIGTVAALSHGSSSEPR
jgi:glucose/arabinose dehydrogenase